MVRRSDRATITDVARAAKVSVSTVSRVINGNTTVDPELAERVRETAAALGYSADPLARSLVLGRTQTIAVVVPDLANPTFQSMLRGISRAAALDGYHVLVADSDEQTEAERGLALATRRRTDGVLLVAPRMSSDELSALVEELRPTVVVNRAALQNTPVVAVDYRSALGELIEHLRSLGHRRMMYLAGAERSVSNAARLAAIDEARLADPSLEITVRPTGVDFDSGVAATDAVIESGATGVLAFNDLVAMGLVSGLGEHGIRVPEQVSVVGFDDIPFARHTTPPLTTASVPSTDVGADAWAAMRTLLDGDEPTPFAVHVPTVITRASSGPAPA